MFECCRSVEEFERLNKIGEGTYGVVYKARAKNIGEIVALKKIKLLEKEQGFPIIFLREINILLKCHHPSIIHVNEVVVGTTLDDIFIVMEYVEHDLKSLSEKMKHPFSQTEIKFLMIQLLEGVRYFHDNWIMHRDLKPSNLLVNDKGELKIGDFGLTHPIQSPLKNVPYTHNVVTLWYRSPELLLGGRRQCHSTTVDMWSLGCIMVELLNNKPISMENQKLNTYKRFFKFLEPQMMKFGQDLVNYLD
ncbi:Cyclin-dependent kinase G-2 [Capsicum annuum]|uniref:Cyclin-dependent kinase G-2 n=1 Tax=Capsicum annuum TaxID=4072 RepID=A0A2G3AP88_CAPAN|nr:Cyclin-dependent kinase G-2 [Capsicum annuum]